MIKNLSNVCVCICTFKRPVLLGKLLHELKFQRTEGLFSYSVVVVDNDLNKSAHDIVESFKRASNIDVRYSVEPEQNIAHARNRAVENARGDYIAFIDDDEYPTSNWLLTLFKAIHEFRADGILGPVLPYYEITPPQWIIKGKFHERPSHETGSILRWTETRSGNVILRKSIFDEKDSWFREEFGSGGEDKDLFRRLINKGGQFVWCAEAPVYEVVPPERFKRSFMLRRALLRGKTPYNHSVAAYMKSLIAIPFYTLLLPFLIFIQHHIFMKILVSYFDHIGRMLSLFGFNVIKEKYVLK